MTFREDLSGFRQRNKAANFMFLNDHSGAVYASSQEAVVLIQEKNGGDLGSGGLRDGKHRKN